MARTRNLKPRFFTNEELAGCGPYAMLLYAGLWTIADCEGRLEDRPVRIKTEVQPYFDTNPEELLATLAKAGFIRRYIADGRRYIQIDTFRRHQKPHQNEESEIPPPPMVVENRENSRTVRENILPILTPYTSNLAPLVAPSSAAADSEPAATTNRLNSGSAQKTTAGQDADPVVLTFPIAGRGATEWHLRQSFVAELASAFPRVDTLAACRHALLWCKANANKRKTSRGMPNFLTSWLGRAQNKGECLRCDSRSAVADPVAVTKEIRQRAALDRQDVRPLGDLAAGLKGTLKGKP